MDPISIDIIIIIMFIIIIIEAGSPRVGRERGGGRKRQPHILGGSTHMPRYFTGRPAVAKCARSQLLTLKDRHLGGTDLCMEIQSLACHDKDREKHHGRVRLKSQFNQMCN